LPVLITVILAFGVGYYVYSRSKKDGGGNWALFNNRGKEAGFSLKEVEMLRQIAIQSHLEDPCSLFSSQDQFDICLRLLIKTIKSSGVYDEPETQTFLSKLYNYRQKIEMNKPASKGGISNSRQIGEGQYLKILVQGSGVFRSQVVNNTNQYLTISRPISNKGSSTMSWSGAKISIYFWREDDAGYVFDAYVQDEVFSKGVSSLKIEHSESLFRTQKRKSIRIKIQKVAYLYLVSESEQPHKIESAPGLKCFLEDISDTGCSLTVGGKAEDSGMRVKVQFALDNTALCMSGAVRSTSYNADTNRSVLRIEADPLPMETRNRILGEIFGTQEDDDDLPFRVLDDEAESISAQAAPAGRDSFFGAGKGFDIDAVDVEKNPDDAFSA
jgi:c-di-GMP-binding flagellar brake protein YcgR